MIFREKIALFEENPPACGRPPGTGSWHRACFLSDMNNGTNLAEPEPRRKGQDEATTRIFWKPALPESTEPRAVPPPMAPMPYLLAPHPWPRGQFRIDPEA